ncbi:MAG: sigma-54 dependent transcriptional regulator [Candidatus Zixiibacteriota bacterium]
MMPGKPPTNILLVDDDPEIAQAVVNYLTPPRYNITVVSDGAEVLPALRRVHPDLVLLDVHLPSVDGLQLLKQIKDQGDVAVIIMSGYVSTGNAIEAMKDGAFEYLTKPFRLEKLEKIIARATGEAVRPAVTADNDVPLTDDQIIGKSPEIVEVAKIIGQIADSDAPVLVIGETGTGKESVARALHRNSKRSEKPFVVINCAATSEMHVEAELFGLESNGTGTNQTPRIGRFEQADGGTVFLDEVADLSIHAQSKLLRLLQEGSFERMSGERPIKVNVRVVAATTSSLVDLMKEGKFRVDLFYRLKVISLFLPPLRERRSDIELVSEFFIKKYARKTGRPFKPLSAAAREKLLKYPWPGNVRELENAIHTAIVLSKEAELLPDDFPMIGDPRQSVQLDFDQIKDDYQEIFRQAIAPLFDKIAMTSEGKVHGELTDALEQILVECAMSATGQNQVRSAQLLGISRNTLRERLKRFELATP